ncbi:hypothetical protein AAF712_002463 [Marasmius tenuissimus]|uniref:DNA2/NAM7 helicase helicase domain-containing protein n=1 Tax=Marasmius tenuissimus TaxID=585030 RepID=A0ABR3A9J0_9AGAR
MLPEPLLVCTYTNVAVDNLVEGLASAGLKPLRASSAGKVRPGLEEHTMEFKMEKHALYPEMKKLSERKRVQEKELDEVKEKLAELRVKEFARNLTEKDAKRMKRIQEDVVKKERVFGAIQKRLFGIEQRVRREVLEEADVVSFDV